MIKDKVKELSLKRKLMSRVDKWKELFKGRI